MGKLDAEKPDADLSLTQVIKAVFAVSFGLLIYAGYCLMASPRVREQAADLPRMTCNELLQNGAGNHRYVTLTDACLSGDRSVAERDSDTGALEMYHPLYAANLKQEPAPRDLNLILALTDEMERRRIRDDRNQRQQAGRAGLSPLTAEVKRGGESLPRWARDGLLTNFPGILLGKCWILTVSGDEPTIERAQRLWRHGLWSTAAAAVLLLAWLASRPSMQTWLRRSLRRTVEPAALELERA